ncbi:hypothetical protein ACPCG0_00475 [Propionibacteriaceae bacterium Y1923]
MSAATLTRETGAAVRPARVRLTQPSAQPSAPASPRRRPARPATASSVRACSMPPAARPNAAMPNTAMPRTATGPSDAGLLAIMVAVALVFLFGLVVLVQGFWAVSQPTEAPAAQPVVVGLP